MPLLLALRYWEAADSSTAIKPANGRRIRIWIPADTGKRWVQRTQEPDEMVVLASALGLDLPRFIALHASAEDGDLIAA